MSSLKHVYVPICSTEEFSCAFARFNKPQIIFQIIIKEGSLLKFDKHRLAVIIIDDEIAIDFCDIKAFSDLQTNLDMLDAPTTFMFEDRDLSGVVWHGLVNEGTGIIGKAIKCSKFVVRAYFNDYSTYEIILSNEETSDLKRSLLSDIIGI